jgi:hypothetical protein
MANSTQTFFSIVETSGTVAQSSSLHKVPVSVEDRLAFGIIIGIIGFIILACVVVGFVLKRMDYSNGKAYDFDTEDGSNN